MTWTHSDRPVRPYIQNTTLPRMLVWGIADVIHLTKSKRFLDEAMPAVMQAVRTSRPDAPLAEEELQKLRQRTIENCQDIWNHSHASILSLNVIKVSRIPPSEMAYALHLLLQASRIPPSEMAYALHLQEELETPLFVDGHVVSIYW